MKVSAIAVNTFRESIRQPVLYIVLFVSAVLLVFAPVSALFSLGAEERMLCDLAQATILLAGLFIVLFSASGAVADEIENGTVLTVLSKPVGRETFVLGKFLGVAMTVALTFAFLAVVFLGTLCYTVEWTTRVDTSAFWQATALALACIAVATLFCRLALRKKLIPSFFASFFVFAAAYLLIVMTPSDADAKASILGWAVQSSKSIGLVFIHVVVIAALSVAVSTRAGLVINAVVCALVFLGGHLSSYIYSKLLEGGGETAAPLVYKLVPDFEAFNVSDAISTGRRIPWSYVMESACYGALLCATFLLMGFIFFCGREMK